jgi:hypothetical protein
MHSCSSKGFGHMAAPACKPIVYVKIMQKAGLQLRVQRAGWMLRCFLVLALAAAAAGLPPEVRCLPAGGAAQLCRVDRFVLLPGQPQDAWTPQNIEDAERRLLRSHFRPANASGGPEDAARPPCHTHDPTVLLCNKREEQTGGRVSGLSVPDKPEPLPVQRKLSLLTAAEA